MHTGRGTPVSLPAVLPVMYMTILFSRKVDTVLDVTQLLITRDCTCGVGMQPCLPVLCGIDELMPGAVPSPDWQPPLVFPGEQQLPRKLERTQCGGLLNKPISRALSLGGGRGKAPRQ